MIYTKRKVFISHYKEDKAEVEKFISDFSHVFIPKVLGANNNDDFIQSTDTDYVMRRIREKYLGDSTVTIVLIGSCTHSRRYVDWEIKSSLRGGTYTPNGLIAVLLPSQGTSGHLPPRFMDNWNETGTGYARFIAYPKSESRLAELIEDAYAARTSRSHLISNSKEMMKNNKKCNICKITH